MADIPTSVGSGRLFSGILSFKLIVTFLSVILISIAYTAITTGDINSSAKEVGSRLLTPTLSLQQESLKIINQQTIYVQDNNSIFWIKLWRTIVSIWGLISPLYLILAYLKIFAWTSRKIILWNEAAVTSSYVLAFIFFFGGSMIYLSMHSQSLWSPFLAFRDFFYALGYILVPLKSISNRILP